MNNPLEQASYISTLLDFIIKYIIPLIAAGLIGERIGLARASKKFRDKKEKRLFANISRPVALLPSGSDSMELEYRLLKSVEFFNVDLLPADARSLDEISGNYRLAIIRYDDSERFWRVFNSLADKRVPLIIYSKPVEIPKEHLNRVQDHYTRYTLCNTPVRLVSDVYAIMSVYPEDDHGR